MSIKFGNFDLETECPACEEPIVVRALSAGPIEKENAQLRAQLAEAREVIEFYGAEKTYIIPAGSGDAADWVSATCPAQDDIGMKARAFLAKYPKGDT